MVAWRRQHGVRGETERLSGRAEAAAFLLALGMGISTNLRPPPIEKHVSGLTRWSQTGNSLFFDHDNSGTGSGTGSDLNNQHFSIQPPSQLRKQPLIFDEVAVVEGKYSVKSD